MEEAISKLKEEKKWIMSNIISSKDSVERLKDKIEKLEEQLASYEAAIQKLEEA